MSHVIKSIRQNENVVFDGEELLRVAVIKQSSAKSRAMIAEKLGPTSSAFVVCDNIDFLVGLVERVLGFKCDEPTLRAMVESAQSQKES